jgi:hypothetical protein
MMLQAVEHGFIDDVSEVLETFISEAKAKAILVAESSSMIWMAPSSENMPMAASETVSTVSPDSLAACRRA